MTGRLAWKVSLLISLAIAGPAIAKDVTVHVDARSGPWNQSVNPKLPYGGGSNRPPKMVWGERFLVGSKITFRSSGLSVTAPDGQSLDPDGEQDWPQDRGGYGLFPSHYMDVTHRPVFLNELVGAFVDADGVVVGKPFAIGKAAEVPVPAGAAAISLGVNDDNYSDNTGGIDVTIHIPEANVTVGPATGTP